MRFVGVLFRGGEQFVGFAAFFFELGDRGSARAVAEGVGECSPSVGRRRGFFPNLSAAATHLQVANAVDGKLQLALRLVAQAFTSVEPPLACLAVNSRLRGSSACRGELNGKPNVEFGIGYLAVGVQLSQFVEFVQRRRVQRLGGGADILRFVLVRLRRLRECPRRVALLRQGARPLHRRQITGTFAFTFERLDFALFRSCFCLRLRQQAALFGKGFGSRLDVRVRLAYGGFALGYLLRLRNSGF